MTRFQTNRIPSAAPKAFFPNVWGTEIRAFQVGIKSSGLQFLRGSSCASCYQYDCTSSIDRDRRLFLKLSAIVFDRSIQACLQVDCR